MTRSYCPRCGFAHGPGEGAKRFTVRTRYHVWTVIDRDGERAPEHFGARGRGDDAARTAAHERRDELNQTKGTECQT